MSKQGAEPLHAELRILTGGEPAEDSIYHHHRSLQVKWGGLFKLVGYAQNQFLPEMRPERSEALSADFPR